MRANVCVFKESQLSGWPLLSALKVEIKIFPPEAFANVLRVLVDYNSDYSYDGIYFLFLFI